MTVQGPVKEQQPDGLSHRGGGGGAVVRRKVMSSSNRFPRGGFRQRGLSRPDLSTTTKSPTYPLTTCPTFLPFPRQAPMDHYDWATLSPDRHRHRQLLSPSPPMRAFEGPSDTATHDAAMQAFEGPAAQDAADPAAVLLLANKFRARMERFEQLVKAKIEVPPPPLR